MQSKCFGEKPSLSIFLSLSCLWASRKGENLVKSGSIQRRQAPNRALGSPQAVSTTILETGHKKNWRLRRTPPPNPIYGIHVPPPHCKIPQLLLILPVPDLALFSTIFYALTLRACNIVSTASSQQGPPCTPFRHTYQNSRGELK